MRRIDPTQGPRAALYQHFRGFARPLFTLCAPIEVGPLLAASSAGIFPTLLRQVLVAANSVPELRQRIRIERGRELVVEHETVDCTCTVARTDGSFTFCNFPYPEQDFFSQVSSRVAAAASGEGLDLGDQGRDDMLYLTCIPWLDFATMQHAETGDPLDCVPRVAWGRVVEGRVTMCLTAHHSLVDGLHASRFFAAMALPEGG